MKDINGHSNPSMNNFHKSRFGLNFFMIFEFKNFKGGKYLTHFQ